MTCKDNKDLNKKEECTKKDLEEKKIEADTSQREGECGCDKPSSDVYSNVEGKDAETGVEIPTDEAVEEAKEWVDENQM